MSAVRSLLGSSLSVSPRRLLAAALLALAPLAACGGGEGTLAVPPTAAPSDAGAAPPDGAPDAVDGDAAGPRDAEADAADSGAAYAVDARIQKLRARPGDAGFLALRDTCLHALDSHGTLCRRELVALDEGLGERGRADASFGGSGGASDFAVHPSGEVTVVGVARGEFRFARFSAELILLAEGAIGSVELQRGGAPADAGAGCKSEGGTDLDDVAVEALGDDVVLASSACRGTVAVHRVALARASAPPVVRWSRVLAPGFRDWWCPMNGVVHEVSTTKLALTRGDGDAVYVAAQVEPEQIRAHNALFGDALEPSVRRPGPSLCDARAVDVLLARLEGGDGRRAYARIVGVKGPDVVSAVAARGDRVFVGGNRVVARGDGGVTDSDLAVAAFRAADGTKVFDVTLDVDDGDFLFDVAPLAGGGVAVVGTTGWHRVATGSVTGYGRALVLRLSPSGAASPPLSLPRTARHDELRSIALASESDAVVGGVEDAPISHDGELDRRRLAARALVKKVTLPP